jgi:3-keto-5-aminohexanoate cleavage enzyme
MPPIDDTVTVAEEYVRAVNAGASLVHHHGVHYLEDKIQPDGRKLSKINFEGWQDLTDRIRSKVDAIIQYGIASARVEEKIKLMDQSPEMMSFCFNAHDEYFRPDPAYPPNELYAIHPRSELEQFCKAALEHNVKPDVESFHAGAIWNYHFLHKQGLIQDPAWITMFLGWPGGAWTPPDVLSLVTFAQHLPAGVNWTLSVMDPSTQWLLLPVAIALGGHVRVGWEDNPYLPNGELSKTNAELVEMAVKMAQVAGREVATAAEAREIMGLAPRPAVVGAH